MTPWSLLRRTALFQRETELTDTGQIIGWWEVRRVPYNLLVGIAGVVSIAACFLAVALAAARTGVSVALVERFGCLGGNLTAVGVEGFAWYRHEQTVTQVERLLAGV